MLNPFIDALEGRRLLAGVTVLTHGWNGHLAGFMDQASKDIMARLGGASQVAEYYIKIGIGDSGLEVKNYSHVAGTATPQSTSSGEFVLLVDWLDIDTNPDFQLNYTGRVIAQAMENTVIDGVRLAELPMHLMSLSRGTALMDELAHALGNNGVWVDHETYLDAHPIPIMQDPPPLVYDNVAFADSYWRTDNDPKNTDSNGQPVPGAYNVNVQFLNDDHAGYDAKGHLAPSGYYNGTIDVNSTDGGEGPIHTDWYGVDGRPARDQTGFIYSSIVGAARPLEGTWAASGGSGDRFPTTVVDAQWANISDVAVVGKTTFAADEIFQVHYIQQDRDSNSHVSFFLDKDKNPYNDNASGSIGGSNFEASSAVASGQTSVVANGVSPGTYFIVAKITDAQGHVRYAYSQQSVKISSGTGDPPPVVDPPPVDDPPPVVDPPPDDPPPDDPPPDPTPPPAAVLGGDHTLRVAGTTGNDVIRLNQASSVANRLMVTVNGTVYKFALSNVQRILVYGLDGDDSLVVNERYGGIFIPTRLMGAGGNDTLVGGSGNDTLTGDAGNDFVFGEVGNDVLYGDIGTDFMDGGNGVDRIYGGADGDTILGGSQNDIVYGEAGNDSILGGNGNDHIDTGTGTDFVSGGAGNDTIDGQDGAMDIINGGIGIDSVHGDLIDQLTAVEARV